MSVIPTLESQILDYYFDNAGTVPRIGDLSGSYIGLCSASPGESGTTANELTNLGIPNRRYVNEANWTVSVGQAEYGIQLTWSPSGSGAASHFLLGDSNVHNSTHDFYDSLFATVNYTASDTIRIRNSPPNLIVSVTGLFSYAGGATTAPANALMRNLLLAESIAEPTGGYFALSTTAPNPDGTNVTEPTGGSYTRTTLKTFSLHFNNPTGSSPSIVTSVQAIIWPEATASWGTVTHWACYSASTGGLMLYYGTIDNPTEVTNGLQPRFDTGDLILSCD